MCIGTFLHYLWDKGIKEFVSINHRCAQAAIQHAKATARLWLEIFAVRKWFRSVTILHLRYLFTKFEGLYILISNYRTQFTSSQSNDHIVQLKTFQSSRTHNLDVLNLKDKLKGTSELVEK